MDSAESAKAFKGSKDKQGKSKVILSQNRQLEKALDAHKLSEKAKKVLGQEKKDDMELGRVRLVQEREMGRLDEDFERQLRKTATRGGKFDSGF
jgi:hypothetical protein